MGVLEEALFKIEVTVAPASSTKSVSPLPIAKAKNCRLATATLVWSRWRDGICNRDSVLGANGRRKTCPGDSFLANETRGAIISRALGSDAA